MNMLSEPQLEINYNLSTIPITAEAAIYTTGCFLNILIHMNNMTPITSASQLIAYNISGKLNNNGASVITAVFATPSPAEDIRAVDAGRRP